jgi:hypothetical protein
MTTIQENMNSPFIQKLAAEVFGTQHQYINDLLKIKKLMHKTSLGILSKQLFLILTQKYPVEYNYLLTENIKTVIEKEDSFDKKEDKKKNTHIQPEKPVNKEKEIEQQIYQNWIHNYGRP